MLQDIEIDKNVPLDLFNSPAGLFLAYLRCGRQ